VVDLPHHLVGLVGAVNEGQPDVARFQVKLSQDCVAKGFGGDAGAVRNEKHAALGPGRWRCSVKGQIAKIGSRLGHDMFRFANADCGPFRSGLKPAKASRELYNGRSPKFCSARHRRIHSKEQHQHLSRSPWHTGFLLLEFSNVPTVFGD
jgi:hypothetical protein